MENLNELIDFYEMAETDPQLLVWLLELRRHRENNWQQRAETAEAKLETAVRAVDNLDAERNALRAKLADLKEQKADFHVRQVQTEHGRAWVECGADYERGRHFFTRPAPAINLAELLEVSANKTADEIIHLFDGIYDDKRREWSLANDVWDACHAAILRNIEEAG